MVNEQEEDIEKGKGNGREVESRTNTERVNSLSTRHFFLLQTTEFHHFNLTFVKEHSQTEVP